MTITINSKKHGEKHILIDDCDAELISKYKWFVVLNSNKFYALAHVYDGDKRTTISMHKLILSTNGIVTHKDDNGLNNMRNNLTNGGRCLIERFEKKLYYGLDGCWYWIGSVSSNGYGYIMKPSTELQMAHRISFELHKGKIPHGLLVCHRCDNTLCVNPDHLFLGTNKDNTQDMINKNRGRWKTLPNNRTH